MERRKEPPEALIELASEQGGCLTRDQCLRAGLSQETIRRLLRGGWTRTARGVYCLGSLDWTARLWTGLLAGGPESVAGSHAAAHLEGFLDAAPHEVVVWTGSRWVRQPPAGVTARRAIRRGRGVPPRTRPEDTILDLAWDRVSPDELIAIVGQAFSGGFTTPGRVLDTMSHRTRQAQRQLIGALCGDLRGVDSPLELRFVKDVQRPHALPVPKRQVCSVVGRYDNLFPEQGVAVELDGVTFHRGRLAYDMRRDNASLVQLGYVTLRYGWRDIVDRPCAVAAEIARVLNQRGWTGSLASCHNCRQVPAPLRPGSRFVS